MTIDESEVVRVLAERLDMHPVFALHGLYVGAPKFLESIDALRPVLAKLTPEERQWLIEKLEEAFTPDAIIDYDAFAWHCLTLDPPVLARAVAEAVLACRKEGGG